MAKQSQFNYKSRTLVCNSSLAKINFRTFQRLPNIFLLLYSLLIFSSCGESTVEIGPKTYEPKIVIEGYLMPDKKVEGIKITRNIPLNVKVDQSTLVQSDADVRITDLQTGKQYKLTYIPEKFSFGYTGSDLTIGFGKSYKLKVLTTIDGKTLSASSITTVPKEGFKILRASSNIGTMGYREKDVNGNLKFFSCLFSPSANTNYYFLSIVALNASDSTFIYDNAFLNVKPEDVKKYLDSYKYRVDWIQNVNSLASSIQYNIDWIAFWFYGDYRIIAYAGDDNFNAFALTHKDVQDFDGNLHEPRFNIQGDGIGVFGSMIADTVFVRIKK